MGILQTLKSKLASRKAAKGAKSKPSFRAWCKAGGHEVGQDNVGELMKRFIEATKPGKAGVRAAIAAEVATAISGKVPATVDHEALDEATKVSAKAGSHAAIALRSALDLEPALPAGIEAQIDRVNALLDSGRQAEGLRLLKVTLAQLQPTLPEAKATGSSLSASSKTVQPTHSKKAEQAVDGAKLSAPSVKASKPATAPKPKTDCAVQLSDKPASSAEAVRKERVRRLLADAGMPLKSLEGIWWSGDGERSLRSTRDILRRQIDGAKSWKEREPLELLILETLQGKHQPVDLFRRFRLLSDDDANTRTILR